MAAASTVTFFDHRNSALRGVDTLLWRARALGAGSGQGDGAMVPCLPHTDAAVDDRARFLLGRPATPLRGAPALGGAAGDSDLFVTDDTLHRLLGVSSGTPGRPLSYEGYICMATTIRRFGYSLGSDVALTSASSVHGNVGVFIHSTGDSVVVEQVTLRGAPPFGQAMLTQLPSIFPERCAATPPASEPCARPPTPDAIAAAGDAVSTLGIAASGQRQPGALVAAAEPDALPHPAYSHRVLSLKGDQNGKPFLVAREVANTLKPATHPAWPLMGLPCAIGCLVLCISQAGGAFSARVQLLLSIPKLTHNDTHT